MIRRSHTYKNRQRLDDPKNKSPTAPSLMAWHRKAALVSQSVANSACALVVLVIEDEFLVRCNIADCLRDAGYVVLETASGEDAIALCGSDTLIDIVFTDINLVGVASGWDVAESFQR